MVVVMNEPAERSKRARSEGAGEKDEEEEPAVVDYNPAAGRGGGIGTGASSTGAAANNTPNVRAGGKPQHQHAEPSSLAYSSRPAQQRGGGYGNANSSSNLYIPPAKRKRLEQERVQRQQQQQKQQPAEEPEEGEEVAAATATNDTAITTTTTLANPNANNAYTLDSSSSSSLALQKSTWDAEKRIVLGTINRLSMHNIKPLIHDLFDSVNLLRMRGVLCKAILTAAVTAPPGYAAVYAALVAVLHSKLPTLGQLLVERCILDFRISFRRRDKQKCTALVLFLGHLFHQAVVHELLLLQILTVLLDNDAVVAPSSSAATTTTTTTDDAVQVAVRLLSLCGYALREVSPAGVRGVLEQLRGLLHEGLLEHRQVQHETELLLEQRRDGFRNQLPIVPPELDLVEQDEQITLEMDLDDADIERHEELDVFCENPNYAEEQQEWNKIRAEVLGLDSDDDDDDEGDSETDGDDDEEQEEGQDSAAGAAGGMGGDGQPAGDAGTNKSSSTAIVTVQDLTEADLVHLRRTIYLTIMSSATFEECTHKLAKIDIPTGREEELINMLIECCSQERTFLRYYGLISSRFCLLHDRWRNAFMDAFTRQYSTIHRLETNKLRNVAKLFAHLLHTDSIPWSVLSVIHLNEDETTSSSRIFVKILVQEMAEAMGMAKLKERFDVQQQQQQDGGGVNAEWYKGMFPQDFTNPNSQSLRNTRYAINFFTSIGLGPLTDAMREYLKAAPGIMASLREKQQQEVQDQKLDDEDDASSVVSSSSSSSSSSSTSSSSSDSSSSSYTSSSSSSSGKMSDSARHRVRGRSRGTDRRGRRRHRRSLSYSTSSSSVSSSSAGSHLRLYNDRRRRSSQSPPTPSLGSSLHDVDKGNDIIVKNGKDLSRSRSPSLPRRDGARRRGRDRDSGSPPSPKYSTDEDRGSRKKSHTRRSRRPASPMPSTSPPSPKYSSDEDQDSRKKSSRRPSPPPKTRKSETRSRRARRDNDSQNSSMPSSSSASNKNKGSSLPRMHNDKDRNTATTALPSNAGGTSRNGDRSPSVDSFGREKRTHAGEPK